MAPRWGKAKGYLARDIGAGKIRLTAIAGDDQWQACRERFGRRHIKTFAARWQHNRVCRGVELDEFRHRHIPVDHEDVGCFGIEALQPSDLFQHVIVRIRKTLDDETNRVIIAERLGISRQQHVDTLAREAGGDMEESKGRFFGRPAKAWPGGVLISECGVGSEIRSATHHPHRQAHARVDQCFSDKMRLNEDPLELFIQELHHVERHETFLPRHPSELEVGGVWRNPDRPMLGNFDHRPILVPLARG